MKSTWEQLVGTGQQCFIKLIESLFVKVILVVLQADNLDLFGLFALLMSLFDDFIIIV